MTDDAPAIRIENLVKRYGRRPLLSSSLELGGYFSALTGRSDKTVCALDGVDLSVRRGEVFGLLGPNGAGKTTLIKILSTLILPDSGRALVYGLDVVRKPREVLRVVQTVLAQSAGFEIRLSGRKNLELYAALYGIPREVARKRISELIEFTNLGPRADSVFQSYSTGMARKLLVCRALLSNASLLIFDEPTSSLDPITASEFRRFISKDLVKDGRTVFIATHNLHEAEEICDRIALIKNGKVLVVGTPAEVRSMVGDTFTVEIALNGVTGSKQSELSQGLSGVAGMLDMEMRRSDTDVFLSIVGRKGLDYNAIFGLLLREQLRIKSVQVSEPDLEEAFLSLLKRGRN